MPRLAQKLSRLRRAPLTSHSQLDLVPARVLHGLSPFRLTGPSLGSRGFLLVSTTPLSLSMSLPILGLAGCNKLHSTVIKFAVRRTNYPNLVSPAGRACRGAWWAQWDSLLGL